MPERTLSMIVEGSDQASEPVGTARLSVEQLGAAVTELNPKLAELNQITNATATSMKRVESPLVTMHGRTFKLGEAAMALNPHLAELTEQTTASGTSATKAIMPLMYLASSFRLINRRVAIGVGRVARYTQAITEAGGAAGGASAKMLIMAGAVVIALAVVVTLAKAVFNAGKKIIEWSGVTERSTHSLKDFSKEGREATRSASDLAWAMDHLSAPSSVATRSMEYTSSAAAELGNRVRELMREWGPLTLEQEAAARAAAANQAVMEYETQAARDLVDAAQDSATAIDRWDFITGQLADTTKNELQPAVDDLVDRMGVIAESKGPGVARMLGTLASSTFPVLATEIEKVATKLTILLGIMTTLTSTTMAQRWDFVKGVTGDLLAPGGPSTPLAVPTPAPAPIFPRFELPMLQRGAGFEASSGPTSININVGGVSVTVEKADEAAEAAAVGVKNAILQELLSRGVA